MDSKSLRRPLLLAVLHLLSLVAMPVVGRASTLTDLFAGGSLSAGSTQFSNWELLAVDSLTLPLPDLGLVEVVPLADDLLNPGVQLLANGELSTAGLDNTNLVVKFKVSTTPTERLIGYELDLSDVAFGGTSGVAFVSADMVNGAGDGVASALVMSDKESDFFLSPDQSTFDPEVQLNVTWDVFITGFSASSPVSLNSFTHRFAVAAVPEPTGLSLLVVMACRCAVVRRFGR